MVVWLGQLVFLPLSGFIELMILRPTLDATKDVNVAGSIGVGVEVVARLASPNV